ncbi:hypothetical protein NC651_021485 [Populus alba x Populus x berolinensis]|nr:hypothetical protein NC651_021485 [Populus alba x Populus x berolinensis]
MRDMPLCYSFTFSENEYCLTDILLDAVVLVPSLVVMESGNYRPFSLNLVQVLQFVRARVLVLWYSNNGETDMFLQYLFWYVNGFSKFAYVELLIATTCINFRLAMLSAV